MRKEEKNKQLKSLNKQLKNDKILKVDNIDNEYSIYIKNRFNDLELAYQKAGILSETKEGLIFE